MSDIIDAKEKLLIEFLLSSRELFIKCSGVLKSEYFEEPLDRVIDFSMGYYMKYHNVPEISIVEAETDVKLKQRKVEQDEFDYVSDEIEKHCQNAAMRIAIIKGSDILVDDEDSPDMGAIQTLVRNALMVSIDKDLGTNYFDKPAIRLMQMQEEIDACSIGWIGMDMLVDKVKRGEMFMFAGSSGSGKSIMLANVANNMAARGNNVLIISLELDQFLISKRMDSIITEIDSKKIFESIDDIVTKLEEFEKTYGSIYVKKMPSGTNANQIRAYLTEYEIQFGYKPDVICLDYLDIMGTNERVNGNIFDIDKAKSEELREIFQDYRAYGFTASQLNRDAVDTERKSQAHIAGGISKINTSDVTMAIIRNEEQKDNGEVHFQLMKLRNSEFSYEILVLYWNDKTLRITEKQHNNPNPNQKTNKVKSRLNDIINKKKEK